MITTTSKLQSELVAETSLGDDNQLFSPAKPVGVLLVDDEPRNLDALESVLSDPGLRLVRAHNAGEALTSLIEEDFAVIVLDVRMPEVSGLQLAQVIKERKTTRHIPIIFLTAYCQEDEEVVRGYGAGAVDYLGKPFNPAILRSKVAVFVDLYRKTQALQFEINERRRLEVEVAHVVEREQRRLGEELHDGLGQQLAGIGYMIGAVVAKMQKTSPGVAREGRRIQELITQSVDQTRALAKGFYPVELERNGLLFALQEIAQRAQQVFRIACVVQSDNSSCIELKGEIGVQLFRIAQEAMHNAVKHSQAKQISIELCSSNGSIVLTIKDDGCGFALKDGEVRGMGLRIMQHRARVVGGSMHFGNEPTGGAIVTCTIPQRDAPSGSSFGPGRAKPALVGVSVRNQPFQ